MSPAARKTPAKSAGARRSPARKAAKRPAAPGPEATAGITAYLAVDDAAKAIDWYKQAFGARELRRQKEPGGKVIHCELELAGGRFFLSDTFPGADTEHPTSLGGTTVSLQVRSPEVDRLWDRAVAAGAAITMPLANQFWGDRYGKLRDPFGHVWALSWTAEMSAAERASLEAKAMAGFQAQPSKGAGA